jgi:hypothetical protein
VDAPIEVYSVDYNRIVFNYKLFVSIWLIVRFHYVKHSEANHYSTVDLLNERRMADEKETRSQ